MNNPRYSADTRRAFLANSPLFSKVDPDCIAALARVSISRDYAKGDKVFSRGDRADALFQIMDGRIRIFRLSGDGKEQNLEVFGPGDVFGEVPMFDGGEYPAFAEAVEASVLLVLSREAFIDQARQNPGLVLAILGLLAGRLRNFIELIDDLSLKDVAPRFARFLLKEAVGKQVRLRIPRRILASCLGTSPETVSRVLAKLQEEGVIRVEGRNIEILDPETLQQLLEQGSSF